MKKALLALLALFLLLNTGCKKSFQEMVIPEATGSPYDLYIVMPDNTKDSALGDTLRNIFEYPMECTPQGDSYFKVYYLTPDNFNSSVIRVVGNVIVVNIDPANASEPLLTIERNTYAQTQVILKMYARSLTELAEYLPEYQEQIRSLFVKAELSRRSKLLQKEFNRTATDRLHSLQNVSMMIPKELNVPGYGQDSTFFWCTNDGPRKRSDIVVYSIPYTDVNVFSLEGAVAVRDSVMKANIEGVGDNSYMTTQKRIIMPEYKALNINGKYVGELKGLWRIENGLMGGPFICHIRLDEINKRVVFAEGFCFAPHDEKRLLIRNLEAVLYTLKLPSDNMCPNIEITLESNNE